MGDDDHGRAVFVGVALHEREDDPPRLGIEGGRRLVGEDQAGAGREGAGDRHALALAAGEPLGGVVDPVAELELREQPAGALGGLARGEIGQIEGHADVLLGRQRAEQVVGLVDEPDLPPEGHHLRRREVVDVVAEDRHLPLLHRAERPDERQEGRLPAARRASQDRDLPPGENHVDVEEGLLAQLAGAKEMVDAEDRHRRRRSAFDASDSRRGGDLGGEGGVHQKRSAGAAALRRRMARSPETTHIPRVRR